MSAHREAASLVSAVEDALGRRVVRLEREPSPYTSTHPIETANAWTDDGSCLRLVLKTLSHAAPSVHLPRTWPRGHPEREIDVYRSVLPGVHATPAYRGVADVADGRCLIIDCVDGEPLPTVGDIVVWEEVARTLAVVHRQLSSARSAERAALARYDADFFRYWPPRALRFARVEDRAALRRLLEVHEAVVERLVALPQIVVHGDLYASNVLVAPSAVRPRIWFVDWETAGMGPATLDVAALTAGSWSEAQRERLALAYLAACDPDHGRDRERFLEDLALCRLHVAMQWLGWSDRWAPPAHQRHDWLAEAHRAVARIRA